MTRWTNRTNAVRLMGVLGFGLFAAACGDEPTAPEDNQEDSQGPAPTVASIEPTSGTVGTDLRISGTDFRDGAAVQIGTFDATGIDVTSGSEIFATVPAGVTADAVYDITVTNADGTTVTLAEAFTAVAPTLSFVNGATKPSGSSGSTVILEGAAFGDAQGPGRVLFSDGADGTVEADIASADDWTDSFILTTVPADAESGPVLVETGTGESESLPFTLSSGATFSPSAIEWTESEALPVAVSGHSATFAPIDDATGETVEHVFVGGGTGNDSVPSADLHYSVIQSDGHVGTWQVGASLASGVTHHATVAATPFNSKAPGSGYLFVMGGVEDKGGQPVDAIHRIALNQDGSTEAAEPAGTLPMPLHSFGAVVFRSTVYIAGGATTDDEPVTRVYRAAIDSLGELGDWEELASLPEARAHHQLVGFGGFLYAVGGDSAAVSVDDPNFQDNETKLSTVAFSRINLRSGLLDDGWSVSASEMQKSRSKHIALAAGGSLFVSSGLYAAAGTGSSENIFASINSDGTLGGFNGATGDNTLLSVGGVNLFNTRGIAYVDADGVAHVMVLGGDDVNNPGEKTDKVIFY
ncbi:MAG: IPT/TIG domain-containing protein [Gemmatimonadota bacterium]|nr:IPT/TIG domain-containing protein [Gemmatimonadota bacterium]